MESLIISFTIPSFDTYTIDVTEEDINTLRSTSFTKREGRYPRDSWKMELQNGDLVISLEKALIKFSPGVLSMRSTCGQVFPLIGDELLERIENYFEQVWRRLYRGFSPLDGIISCGIPLPIAEEIHENICRVVNVLGVELTLKRLPPGVRSVRWCNKDLELPEDGKRVLSIISLLDFISENRRGIDIRIHIFSSQYSVDSMTVEITVDRNGKLDYHGCGSRLAREISGFLL